MQIIIVCAVPVAPSAQHTASTSPVSSELCRCSVKIASTMRGGYPIIPPGKVSQIVLYQADPNRVQHARVSLRVPVSALCFLDEGGELMCMTPAIRSIPDRRGTRDALTLPGLSLESRTALHHRILS